MTTPGIVRVPREWEEPCQNCGGCGLVSRRERFSLWTPDEYVADATSLSELHDIPTDAYVCVAVPGGNIWDACREGVEIARRVGHVVAFEFNGKAVVCRADSTAVDVAKELWFRIYGKTYEQSQSAEAR